MFNVIKEETVKMNNNESYISKGVYFNTITKEYNWLTPTKSGNCKKLNTALKKAGF